MACFQSICVFLFFVSVCLSVHSSIRSCLCVHPCVCLFVLTSPRDISMCSMCYNTVNSMGHLRLINVNQGIINVDQG